MKNTVTIEQILAAMELNGYKKARGSFHIFDDAGHISAACAIGQADANLDTHAVSYIYEILKKIKVVDKTQRLGYKYLAHWITDKSDFTNSTVSNIAKRARNLIVYDTDIKLKDHPIYREEYRL